MFGPSESEIHLEAAVQAHKDEIRRERARRAADTTNPDLLDFVAVIATDAATRATLQIPDGSSGLVYLAMPDFQHRFQATQPLLVQVLGRAGPKYLRMVAMAGSGLCHMSLDSPETEATARGAAPPRPPQRAHRRAERRTKK